MALRNIRVNGDEILRKKCRVVDKITERELTLIRDMKETMYEALGVGIAAPQVGVLKRIFIVDIGDGPIVFINPEIIKVEGSQKDHEGCLSLPGESGEVERPYKVKVRAMDEKGQMFELEGEELLARAICHENDHLEGVLFIDKVIG